MTGWGLNARRIYGRLIFVFGLIFGLIISNQAFASETYSYLGPYYSTTFEPTDLTTEMRPMGSFVVSDGLPPNLNSESISGLLLEYSFNNGLEIFDETNSEICSFYVSTDFSGNIIAHSILLIESPPPPLGELQKFLQITDPELPRAESGLGIGVAFGGPCFFVPAYYAAANPDEHGEWSSTLPRNLDAYSVPAMTTHGQLLLALLMVAFLAVSSWRGRLGS